MTVADPFTAPGERGRPVGIPYSERGPASAESVASFGFWLFLLSDVVMFSGLFAAYAAQRPRLLLDWSAGKATDGLGNALDADLQQASDQCCSYQ